MTLLGEGIDAQGEADCEQLLGLLAYYAGAGDEFCGWAKEGAVIAERPMALDAGIPVTANRLCGHRRRGPDAATLAATVLRSRLGALHAALQYETTAAGETAAEQLCRIRRVEEVAP
jgi:hypothetical protein